MYIYNRNLYLVFTSLKVHKLLQHCLVVEAAMPRRWHWKSYPFLGNKLSLCLYVFICTKYANRLIYISYHREWCHNYPTILVCHTLFYILLSGRLYMLQRCLWQVILQGSEIFLVNEWPCGAVTITFIESKWIKGFLWSVKPLTLHIVVLISVLNEQYV